MSVKVLIDVDELERLLNEYEYYGCNPVEVHIDDLRSEIDRARKAR